MATYPIPRGVAAGLSTDGSVLGQALAPKRKGFGGFIDNLLAPDPNTTAGKIGLLAAHIGREYDSPLANATLGIAEEQRKHRLEDKESMLDRLYKQSQIDRNTRPDRPSVQQNYEYIKSILGPEKAREYLGNYGTPPMQAVDVTNPDGSVVRQFIPRPGATSPQAPQRPPIGSVIPDPRRNGGAAPRAPATFR